MPTETIITAPSHIAFVGGSLVQTSYVGHEVTADYAVSVNGRKWIQCYPFGVLPSYAVRVEISSGGSFARFKVTRQDATAYQLIQVGYLLWNGEQAIPLSGVSFQIPEYPQVFCLQVGSDFLYFVGPCCAVSADFSALNAEFQAGQESVEFEVHWSDSPNDAAVKQRALDDLAAAYPMLLNWPDRRPIGLSYPNQHINDENKWLWEWTTQAEFEAGYHAHVDACIANSLLVDAQGIILWSIEGQSMPHPISYIGDPARHDQFCPESNLPLLQALFAKITAAGMKPGVTVRPQELRPVDWSGFGWYQFDLHDAEYKQALRAKIQWAYDNLACRLFYIDTCMRGATGTAGSLPDAHTVLPPFALIRDVAAEFPDCLLIPEQFTPAWRSVSCPRNAGINDDPDMRYAYPAGMEMLVGQHTNWSDPAQVDILRASVEAGSVAAPTVWYQSPSWAAVAEIDGGK